MFGVAQHAPWRVGGLRRSGAGRANCLEAGVVGRSAGCAAYLPVGLAELRALLTGQLLNPPQPRLIKPRCTKQPGQRACPRVVPPRCPHHLQIAGTRPTLHTLPQIACWLSGLTQGFATHHSSSMPKRLFIRCFRASASSAVSSRKFTSTCTRSRTFKTVLLRLCMFASSRVVPHTLSES